MKWIQFYSSERQDSLLREDFIKVAKDLAVREIIEGVENEDAKFQERSH